MRGKHPMVIQDYTEGNVLEIIARVVWCVNY